MNTFDLSQIDDAVPVPEWQRQGFPDVDAFEATHEAEHTTHTNPYEEEAKEYLAEAALDESYAKARSTHPALISADMMMKKPYPAQRYLIGPKLLPKGGRMLLTAQNGTGKSALSLYMAACMITGTPLFGFTETSKGKETYGQPLFPTIKGQSCLYIDYEIPEANRKEERIKPLTKIFGDDFVKNLHFPRHPSDYRLENGNREGIIGSYDRLYNLVKDTKPNVLVIDPFSSTHSVDENSSAVKQPLNAIDRLIDIAGCAVILVHHESTKELRDYKGQTVEKGTKEKARGHSALTDWADLHLSLTGIKGWGNSADNTKTIQLEWGKTRYCKTPTSRRIEFDFETMAVKPQIRSSEDE